MELTYKLRADSITETLLETIKTQFRGKEISIIVKDVEVVPESSDQANSFRRMENLRAKLKSIEVDPEIDISSLANEVNL
jgi:hypothetical protein